MAKTAIKIIIAILASAYCCYYILTPNTWHFIDNVNFIIHEAGHWIFSFFGQFMYILGGSLNQVLVPCLFVIYFYINRQFYSAALCLFWVAPNLMYVSNYAADAVAMKLP